MVHIGGICCRPIMCTQYIYRPRYTYLYAYTQVPLGDAQQADATSGLRAVPIHYNIISISHVYLYMHTYYIRILVYIYI